MRKKWTFWDIVVLVLEILSPLASIVITCFIPAGKALDSDMRLSIIGAGISIPVVLLQISITQGQNKSENDIQKIDNNVNELSEKINHISPVLEQVFYLAMIEFNDLHIDVLANLVKLFSLQLIITILVI